MHIYDESQNLEPFNPRDWLEIESLWRHLANERSLALIRVAQKGKMPNEGKGWERIHWRRFDDIGFQSEDNAGVLTGRIAGVIVLDVDNEIIFNATCQENCWEVPETFTVQTGKGHHYYYRLPKDSNEYRNRSRKAQGWDARADGGYVVAPGSIHPNGSVYSLVNDREFEVAPQWLLEVSRQPVQQAKFTRKREIGIGKQDVAKNLPDVDLNGIMVDDWVKTAITERAEAGTRSEIAFKVITALMDAGCNPDEIVHIFMGNRIGDKAREKEDPEKWLYSDIERIIAKHLDRNLDPEPQQAITKRTVLIPDIKELSVEYRALVEYSHKDLVRKIQSFGNVTSKSQEEALRSLLLTYAAMANGKVSGRIAFPLPTGLGKTTSISAFLGRASSMGLLGRGKGCFSVAVAASKVDQLCELHAALIEAQVPESYISLVHSYRYATEAQRDADGNLPVGYAELPATPDHNRPIMLLSHNKIKNGPEHAFDDSLEKRSFIIWDESLISTKTRALDVERLRFGLHTFGFALIQMQERKQGEPPEVSHAKIEVAEQTSSYLHSSFGLIEEEISSQRLGNPKEVLRFPHANDMTMTEMLKAVDWVGKAQDIEEARNSILYLNELLRVTEHDTSVHLGCNKQGTVVRFEVVVPDSQKNIVILDASARINTLMLLDESIYLPANLSDPRLSYNGSKFHRIDHASGRGGITEELENDRANLKGVILEVVNNHPQECLLIFTYKHREAGELNNRAAIENYLLEHGADIHQQVNGKPRFNWLTHGNETASNQYTHCTVAVFVGLLHKPRGVNLGETVAQRRKHNVAVGEKMLTDVIRGLHSQAIHQGANRTASRMIQDDQARIVNVYYTYPDDSLVPYLERVLPDAKFCLYESKLMEPRTANQRAKRAVIAYLRNLADDVRRVTAKAIQQFPFCRPSEPS